MKNQKIQSCVRSLSVAWIGWSCLSLGAGWIQAADFTVRTPGGQFAFQINGVNGPTLTLVRGQTYTFDVQTSVGFHPFHVASPGVNVNDIATGTITYVVPTNSANYFYNCTIHGNTMRGEIITVEPPQPPEPPTIHILNLSVGTNLVLTSTGTNTWTTIPEYSTNLVATNWYALTVETNRFSNGTNETICGRPPGNAVFLRIRAARQTP